MKKQTAQKTKKNTKKDGQRKSKLYLTNNKKIIIFLAIFAVCIYFIFALYGLIKEPTNIFMVENRETIFKRR